MRPAHDTRLGGALLGASVTLSALGQLGMKAGMQTLKLAQPLAASGAAVLGEPAVRSALAWTCAGLAAYALSLLAWLGVLARFKLSYAYPLLGASYVLVYAIAARWPLLAEPMSPARTAGTLLIIAGVALVSSTRERA